MLYLQEHGEVRYTELLRNIGKTRGALASSLRDLRKMKLIDRIVDATQTPIQSTYKLTESGVKAVQLLDSLQKLVL